MVVDAEVNETNKTTPGSGRRGLLKKGLPGPTLLEMPGKLIGEVKCYFKSPIIQLYVLVIVGCASMATDDNVSPFSSGTLYLTFSYAHKCNRP